MGGEDYYNKDELLHSEVILHGDDASHGNMSVISSAVGSKGHLVLSRGYDNSFYSQAQQHGNGIEGDDASRRFILPLRHETFT